MLPIPMFFQQAAPAAAAPGGGDMLMSLMLPIGMIVIFYFLLIRPQNQRMKKHRAMIAAVIQKAIANPAQIIFGLLIKGNTGANAGMGKEGLATGKAGGQAFDEIAVRLRHGGDRLGMNRGERAISGVFYAVI